MLVGLHSFIQMLPIERHNLLVEFTALKLNGGQISIDSIQLLLQVGDLCGRGLQFIGDPLDRIFLGSRREAPLHGLQFPLSRFEPSQFIACLFPARLQS